MQAQPIPLSRALLGLATTLVDDLTVPSEASDLLAQFDQTGLALYGYRVYDTEAGELIQLVLPPLPGGGEIVLAMPGLPQFAVVLSAATLGDSPVLEIVRPWGSLDYLELKNLRLGIRFNTDLLRPADGAAHAELAYTGSLRFYTDWNVRLTGDSSLSLTPCEIAGTGIIVEFSGVQFDFSSTATLPGIQALGLPPSFQGIYARQARLQVLPQSVFGDGPGISLDFYDLAVGQSGISGQFRAYYELIYDETGAIDPGSGMVGYLLDEQWQLGLAVIEVALYNNRPQRFLIAGMVRIPPLNSLFRVEFGLQALMGGNYRYSMRIDVLAAPPIQLGPGTLTLDQFQASGALAEDGFAIEGTMRGALNFPGFALEIGEARVFLSRAAYNDEIAITLNEVRFGPLGTVETAKFRHKITTNPQTGQTDQALLLECALAWQDLQDRLGLDPLRGHLPLPPPEAQVIAFLSWEDDKLVLRFSAEVTDLDDLWDFIPGDFLPQVRSARFVFAATYASADAFANSSSDPSSPIAGDGAGGGDTVTADIAVELSLRLPDLPDLPGLDLFQIKAGDEEGWLEAKLKADIAAGGRVSLSMSLENPVAVDVNLPGLPQPEPPIHTRLTKVGFGVAVDEGEVDGGLSVSGDFSMRPILPPEQFFPAPLLPHLQKLLENVGLSALTGRADFALRFKEGRAEMSLDGHFAGAGIELDLFDMVSNLARGIAAPADLDRPGNTIDLDFEVGFELRGVRLKLGSLAADQSKASQFSLELVVAFWFADLPEVEVLFKLSDQEFMLGLSKIAIPLEIPHFPVSVADLEALQDAGGGWDYSEKWLPQKKALNEQIEEGEDALETIKDQLAGLKEQLADLLGSGDETQIAALTAQIETLETEKAAAQKALFQLHGQKFLLEGIFAIYEQLKVNQGLYQEYVELTVGLMDATTGALHTESKILFELSNVKFVIPFQDPRNISLQGGARLTGFHDDDPLRPLEDLIFALGLSSEYIFFSVEGGGDPLPLPDFGRYPDGSVNLKSFRIGYGYTKNSFSLAVAGELVLPPQLIEDADTSDLIGAGLRLPGETRLGFKLDIIPVSLGPVNFVLPLLDFDLDLRRPNAPGLLGTQVCEPYWDGLQLIIPGALRVSLKHIAFAPLFAGLPVPNARYDGDWMIGNSQQGLTLIADNLLLLGYFFYQYPIPFLADGQLPYFENLCLNIRLAGFGLNFNLQRPFPSASPLALFEVLGLLADPLMPIDPNGSLANTIRVTLQDAYLTLPPAVVRMFPESGGIINKEVNITINLGTFLTAVQSIVQAVGPLVEAFNDAAQDMAGLVQHLLDNPPQLSLGEILAAVPPELRKFRLGGSFAGFSASAVLLLIAPEAARAELERRDAPPDTASALQRRLLFRDNFRQAVPPGAPVPGWQQVDEGYAGRSHWRVENGELRQRSNLHDSSIPGRRGPLQVALASASDGDISFSAILRSDDDDGIGLVFRYQNEGTHYRFAMARQQNFRQLIRFRGGQPEVLFETGQGFALGQAYRVEVQVTTTDTRETRLQITLNGRLWCDLIDDQPITAGRIGLYCWANTGARFSRVRLYELIRPAPVFGQPLNPETMAHYRPNVSALRDNRRTYDPGDPAHNLFAGAEFQSFSADDLAELNQSLAGLLPHQPAAGIVVGARVTLFAGQRYRFLGYLFEDGSFGMLSALDIEPLRLSVAGISLQLPLEIHGRLALAGRAKRGGVYGAVTASVWGTWPVIPGLMQLTIGDEAKPVRLQLYSDGRFALSGAASLSLFNGAAVIAGEADISHTHCFIAGRLDYEVGDFKKQPIVKLGLDSRGRIGPGPRFEIGGGGELWILGQELANVRGALTDQGAAVEAHLDTGEWYAGDQPLDDFRLTLDLKGMIDLRKTTHPEFELLGAGRLAFFDAAVEGSGGLTARKGYLRAFLEGKLFWQNREWLSGRIELGSDGYVHIAGQTSFALSLTPDFPAEIKVAGLFFKIDLGGSFTLDPGNGFADCDLKVDWVLGIKLPDASQQTFPIAMQKLKIKRSLSLRRELIHITSLDFLPLDDWGDLIIPVPVLHTTNSIEFYEVTLDLTAILLGEHTLLTPFPPSDEAQAYQVPIAGYITTDDMSLSSLLQNLNFRVYLAWQEGDLGIEIQRGNEEPEFMAFREMFS